MTKLSQNQWQQKKKKEKRKNGRERWKGGRGRERERYVKERGSEQDQPPSRAVALRQRAADVTKTVAASDCQEAG